MKNALVLLVLFFGVCSCYKSYKNHKVYDVITTPEQLHDFSQWQYEEGVDFWQRPISSKDMKILVSPESQMKFENYLNNFNITHQISMDDFEILLEEERQKLEENLSVKPSVFAEDGGRVVPDFTRYWSSAEMEEYCTFLANTYSQLVEMETMVFSPENRRIYAMKVSNGRFGQKPIIAIESGMHAREWVVPPTILYLLHRIIQDPSARNELLERVDWLIVPMLNPDGYEFTRTNDRMWRKNRRLVQPGCIGVDLNRNFEYSWRTATVACTSLVFPGLNPLSEPESFALNQLVARYAPNVKLFLSAHSFGDMVLWPWGYSGSPGHIFSWREHDALGNLWRNDILAQGGRPYIVGNVADVLGNAFGAVDDHMIGTYGFPYTYTLELTSGFNFLYPEARIEALAIETFWGYRAMALHIGTTFNP